MKGKNSWSGKRIVLELDHLSLSFLIAADLEVFAPFDGKLFPILAFGALHSEDNLFGCLGLLSEDGFSLSAKTALFSVVTSPSLSERTLLSLLVLCHFMYGMFTALSFAIGSPSLRYVYHCFDLFVTIQR